jgi:hypothetical protein
VQRMIVRSQIAQLIDAIQIDQMRRPDETKIHQRHETLAAGKRARLIAELRHQAQRFVNGGWIVVIKFCRFHIRFVRINSISE